MKRGIIIERVRHGASESEDKSIFSYLTGLKSESSILPEHNWKMDESMVLSNASDFIGKFDGVGLSPSTVAGPSHTAQGNSMRLIKCLRGGHYQQSSCIPRREVDDIG